MDFVSQAYSLIYYKVQMLVKSLSYLDVYEVFLMCSFPGIIHSVVTLFYFQATLTIKLFRT